MSNLYNDKVLPAQKKDEAYTQMVALQKQAEASHGFEPIEGTPVGADVFSEMLRSHDDGLAAFLDLARVKPNTLGNARMLLQL